MSWVYSKNQNSNYKYREFPTSFLAMSAYATVNNGNYDMRFPIGDDKLLYDKYNSRSDEKYKSIIDNYCLSWFDAINDININDNNILEEFKNRILSNVEFTKVNDGYVYHKGILYNFNDIYNKIINFKEEDKIDYFSMIVNVDTTNIFSEDYIKENLKFVSFNLSNKTPLNIFYQQNVENELLRVNSTSTNKYLDFNNVYKKKENISSEDYLSYLQEHNNESSFIDASTIGIDLYNENSIFKVSDNIGLVMLSMISSIDINKLDNGKRFYNFYIAEALYNLFEDSNDYYNFINDENLQAFKDIIYLQLKNTNNNNLPFFFKSNYGYELYELLPVYKAQEYIDFTNRILSCFYQKYPVFINNDLHNKYSNLFNCTEDYPQYCNSNDWLSIREYISNENKNREGFVIIFDDEFRLKLKYQEYWVLHYLKAGLSRRKILNAYCEGRSDEILKSLEILDEEHKIYYHKIISELIKVFNDVIDKCIDEYNYDYFENRKALADYVKTCTYPSILFAMYDNKPYDYLCWKIVKRQIKNIDKEEDD
jgi:hypothetical protein